MKVYILMRDCTSDSGTNSTYILGAYQEKWYAEEHASHHPAKDEHDEQEGPDGPEIIQSYHYSAAYIQETEFFGQMVFDHEKSIA